MNTKTIEARQNAKKLLSWYNTHKVNLVALESLADVTQALDIANNTIEELLKVSAKEEPAPPTAQKILGIRYTCSICKYTLVNHANYCSNCGQAISWERGY